MKKINEKLYLLFLPFLIIAISFIDNAAHIGGLVSGFGIGLLLAASFNAKKLEAVEE